LETSDERRAFALGTACPAAGAGADFPLVFSSPFMVNFGVLALFYAFIGQSWNIAGGFAGQLSFGHVVFFGAGAYASTIFQLRFGFSPWFGLPASAVRQHGPRPRCGGDHE
jgi:branched-chain amino acid transport system permease protein